MIAQPDILFVDDEASVLQGLERTLHGMAKQWSLRFETCPHRAIASYEQNPADIIISDFRMSGLTGLEMISKMRGLDYDCEFIMLTGSSDFDVAINAINSAGVFRFLTKPCSKQDLIDSIEKALIRLADRRRAKLAVPDNANEVAIQGAALELLATTIIVLDAKTHNVVFANSGGEALLQSADCLSLDQHKICRASSQDITAQFYNAIRQAVDNDDGVAFQALPRGCEDRDLSAVIMRLPRLEHKNDQLVALLIADPDIDNTLTTDGLVQLYGLTQAEARLAHALSRGDTLSEAASHCGVTLESARTYLKRVFSKMSVSRQTDLVKLILSSPAYRRAS